ncbi:bacteriochlorophyll 4-vinyl reductase [Rhodovibrio sodomensis]|uniref:Bacteriochlorophyll 4-vinyl reductase n=2 Tax=Rhodovibrio sodomensis TaxID=1088 RepID=A0ABS1DIE7_9PROT|nr:bacteriochlorophyll 4-vinyl reductase [Rhodovibrio sodomensis]MBK1669786.1 bacteriochlorophyll 4-vinyl reductase [Rhodovibrio sodomensis]
MQTAADAPGDPLARVGPNAITRVGEALDGLYGRATTYAVFADAGLTSYLEAWPREMVAEGAVAGLNRALHAHLPETGFRRVAREAGGRTGDYLLAHRIPKPVQALLRPAPAWLASRVLLAAIARNAWTFAGSGRFDAAAGRPCVVTIAGCPLCREIAADHPVCDTYTGTFERLFRELVHPQAAATETACQAAGAKACRFEIRW